MSSNVSGEDADEESAPDDDRYDTSTRNLDLPTIRAPFTHTPSDDLESLFFIFYYLVSQYDGPRSQKREDARNEVIHVNIWLDLPNNFSQLDANPNGRSCGRVAHALLPLIPSRPQRFAERSSGG